MVPCGWERRFLPLDRFQEVAVLRRRRIDRHLRKGKLLRLRTRVLPHSEGTPVGAKVQSCLTGAPAPDFHSGVFSEEDVGVAGAAGIQVASVSDKGAAGVSNDHSGVIPGITFLEPLVVNASDTGNLLGLAIDEPVEHIKRMDSLLVDDSGRTIQVDLAEQKSRDINIDVLAHGVDGGTIRGDLQNRNNRIT